MSQAPAAKNPFTFRQRIIRRLFRALALVVLLLASMWLSGGMGVLINRVISQKLHDRNYEGAETMIGVAQRLHCATPETVFLEARLRRKLLQVPRASELLSKAAREGFDRERLTREAILLQAQAGSIRPITTKMDQMMMDPRGDGAEICEAYVNGALIAGMNEIALTILPVWKSEFPDDPQSNYALARVLEYQGQLDAAINELRSGIKKNGNHWPTLYTLGRILLGQNSVDEAMLLFESASRMRDNAAPLFQKAKCLRALGQSDEAHAILKELVTRPEEAIRRSFSRVSEPQRGLPIQLELGSLETVLKRYEEAVHWFDVVLEDDPKNQDARYARAIALRHLQRTDEANRDFAEVQEVRTRLLEVDRLVDEIDKNPDEPNVEKRCRIGELFLKYEKGGRGEFWLRGALNRDPDYAPAHRLLAEYYEQLALREPEYAAMADQHRRAAAAANGALESKEKTSEQTDQ
jgi:tetratricopeptide (TPR) repeat protein